MWLDRNAKYILFFPVFLNIAHSCFSCFTNKLPDTKIHESAYLNYMKYKFVAARGVTPEMLTIDKVNLNNVGCYLENGASADEMIALVKKAMKTRTLLVFLFNGVGGEHKINVSLEAHSGLLHYLKQNEKDIWIATMIDVVKFIKSKQ
jgi:sialate O-acetylesterase